MAILKLTDICKDYVQGKEPVRVLKNVNLTMERGDYLAIMGPSGSGKTTLMNIIGCLDVPTSGTYELDGQNLKDMDDDELADIRNKHLGFVFQSFYLMPKLTALDNVALPLLYAGVSLKERRERAAEALKAVGLEERMDFFPNQLSGGQCQRVAIARALALSPDILCFDEPTSALDPELTGEVLKVIKGLADQNTTMIIVTHEMAFARDVSDKVLFMDDGKILEQGTPEEVFENPKEERTRQFLSRYTNG